MTGKVEDEAEARLSSRKRLVGAFSSILGFWHITILLLSGLYDKDVGTRDKDDGIGGNLVES